MPGFWRKCRITFRCVRFAAWLTVLAALLAFGWCNRVGLPGFLKARIVGTLHERGVDLEFSRMRLSLIHGLVAENVRVGQAQTADSPAFAARQVQLDFNFPALLHRRWQLDGLVLRGGQFTLPLSPTNALTLTNLQTDLRFQTNDTWSLDHFSASFSGTQIGISGELAHAPAARHWKLFAGGGTDRGAVIAALNNFSDALRQIHFQGEPQLRLSLAGDARDPHALTVRLNAVAAGVNTPWLAAQDFRADATLTAPANTPTNTGAAWGFWTNLQPFRLAWTVQLGELRSEPLAASNLNCAGVWAAPTLAITNFAGKIGSGNLTVSAALDVATRELTFTNDSQFDWHALAKLLPEKTGEPLAKISWTQPPVLHANGSLRLPSWTNAVNDWGSAIAPTVQVRGDLAFTNAVAGGVKLDAVRTHFSYSDQLWDVPDFTAVQGRTWLRLSGQESAATENFHCLLTGQIDAASVEAMLPTTNAVNGFRLLTFHEPLVLALDVTGNLRTLETLCATGNVALTNFAIRSQTMDFVAAKIYYTNLAANIYSLELRRGDGTQWIKADELFLDFRQMAIWITNGLALMDPQPVANAIGPKTGRVMAAFHFLTLPLVRVHGSTPIINIVNAHDAELADLTFDIEPGVPFRWSKIQTTNLTGTIHWLKQSLILTNMAMPLYEGQGTGGGDVDFRPVGHDCDFDFSFAVTNVNLHLLAADLSTNQNHLEGQLSGSVLVTNASSADWRSWNGGGQVQLRDGRLWDVPIFALLSPVLNAVTPGLGNSRAKEAAAQFLITNGVITTDSLLIRADSMRLQYVGTVDLQQQVDARVTAQLLRNTPVIGSLVSTVLWPVSKIFECRVTGQLGDPIVTPVNIIPKILLVPLHPVRSLEELFMPAPENPAR
jgi:hypothetical protein